MAPMTAASRPVFSQSPALVDAVQQTGTICIATACRIDLIRFNAGNLKALTGVNMRSGRAERDDQRHTTLAASCAETAVRSLAILAS